MASSRFFGVTSVLPATFMHRGLSEDSCLATATCQGLGHASGFAVGGKIFVKSLGRGGEKKKLKQMQKNYVHGAIENF